MEKNPNFDFVKVYDCEPKLEITSEGTNFFDTTIDDVKVEDYYHMPRIVFPVAV
jgi:thymidylate synthase